MNGFSLKNTGVIMDWDRALTKGSYPNPDGGKRIDYTSYSFLQDESSVPKEFFIKNQELHDYYIGVEHDMPKGPEKTEKMLEWPKKVYDLYYEYISEDIFETALERNVGNIHMREGTPEFLQFLSEYSIPRKIFSAGVVNVIHRILENNGLADSGLHVLGNKIRFDSSGKYIVPGLGQIISTENKNWKRVSNEAKNDFCSRANQIVMGDSLGDIHMGDTTKNIHSIGFLLQSNKEPDKFRESFDQVIKSEECDLGELKKIQYQLIQNAA